MSLRDNIFNRMSQEGSAHQLAAIRILLGVQILFSSSSKVFEFLKLVPGTNYTKTIFFSFIQSLINIYAVDYLQILVQVLSLFMIIGVLTRWVLPLLSVLFLVLFSFLYSKFDAPVPWLYIWFPLVVLSFSDCSRVLSIDSFFTKKSDCPIKDKKFRWPIELIAGWWAYIYFAAGLAKLVPFFKGILWLDGATSHKIVYDRYLDSFLHFCFGKPFFDYSEGASIFALLSILSLLIELICVLIYFTNRYNYILFFLVVCMHSFLFLVGVPGFGFLCFIIGISLINPVAWNKYFKIG